jgi:hypothetical protein
MGLRATPAMAAMKNAHAMQLLGRGKLRQALSALNEAIYSAPDYPHSYANRALVFERLGMAPQAEADRRRAQDLARSGGYSESEVFAGPPLQERRPRAPAPRTRPQREQTRTIVRSTRSSWPALSETGVVMTAMFGLALTAVGAYIAVGAIRDADINLNVFDFETFREESPAEPTVEPTPEITPEPTPPPATPPAEALVGNPYSFSQLQQAFQAKGLTVALGYIAPTFSGFSTTPFDITVSRGEATANLYILIYPDRNAPSREWSLSSAPSPIGSRRAAPFERGWFNSNVIVLLRGGNQDVANAAKDAFLGL